MTNYIDLKNMIFKSNTNSRSESVKIRKENNEEDLLSRNTNKNTNDLKKDSLLNNKIKIEEEKELLDKNNDNDKDKDERKKRLSQIIYLKKK